jgi:AcrR family transcriptional regulator
MPRQATATRRLRARASGPERVTSFENVLDTAERILDQEGLNALTMRRLADELGVSSMTVYGYLANKDELLQAVAARVLGGLEHQSESLGWERRLTDVATELRRLLRKHPGVTEIVLSRPAPALDRFRETMLSILSEAGFEVQDAIDILVVTSCYALGFAHSELVRTSTDLKEVAQRLGRLPAADFPHLTAAADKASRPLRDDTFEIGLRSLIRGFAAERLNAEAGREPGIHTRAPRQAQAKDGGSPRAIQPRD